MSNPQDPNGQSPDPYQGGYQQYPAYGQGYPQQGYQQPYGQQPYGQQPYGGGYPPQGPPPKKNRTALFVSLGVAALVVVIVAAVAAFLVLRSPSDETAASPSQGAESTEVGAGDCGIPGETKAANVTDRVASGPLSFPVSAAPGWRQESYVIYAESTGAAGLEKSMDDGQPWQAGAEVGQTNFGKNLEPKDAAARMVPCIAAGAGYNRTNPTISDLSQPEQITVDGVPAAKVTAKILVQVANVTVPGDDVTVIVVDSAPQTYALTVTPIGQADMAAATKAVIEQLKVAKDV